MNDKQIKKLTKLADKLQDASLDCFLKSAMITQKLDHTHQLIKTCLRTVDKMYGMVESTPITKQAPRPLKMRQGGTR